MIPKASTYFFSAKCIVLLLLLWMTKLPDSFAQETKNNIIQNDTAGVNALNKRAFKYRESNPDSAGILYGLALNAARAAAYHNGTGEALVGIGRYYNIKNEQQKAVNYLKQAFQYFENNERGRQLTVQATLLLSEAYYYLGAYDSCSFYRYEALNYVESHDIRDAKLKLSVYSKVLQYWLNAHEDIKHDKNIQQIMDHINVMEKQALATNDSNLLVNIYFQKEGYYHNISQNDSARYYGLKNIELGQRLKTAPSMKMAAYLNIALTYLDDKKPELAIENIRKAVAEAPEQGKESNRYLIFGDIFLGEAYNLQGKYQQSIAVVLPALEAAKKLNIISILETAHKTLADAYEGTGQYKNAAEQRKLYSIAKDSVMKTEKMELSYNLEMKYRISEKNKELTEKELSILKNEAKIKNKNILIGCITAGLVLITLISLLVMRNNRHKQKLQAEKIVSLQQDMEIKTLKAMVSGSEKERSRIARDLHDGISGTVGAARAQLGRLSRSENDTQKANDFAEIMNLLEEAATEIRKTAHNLMPEILLQEGLVSATELFCERTEKSHSIKINFFATGDIPRLSPDVELAIYRTIQELVNNILKHAAATKALVQLNFNAGILSVTVEDNGKGIALNAQRKDFGVGLQTISERIKTLNGTIDISGKPMEGTSVYIEIDTTKSNNKT